MLGLLDGHAGLVGSLELLLRPVQRLGHRLAVGLDLRDDLPGGLELLVEHLPRLGLHLGGGPGGLRRGGDGLLLLLPGLARELGEFPGRLLDARQALLGLGDLRGDLGAGLRAGLQEPVDLADRLVALAAPALQGVPCRFGGLLHRLDGHAGLVGRLELLLRPLQRLGRRLVMGADAREHPPGGLELPVEHLPGFRLHLRGRLGGLRGGGGRLLLLLPGLAGELRQLRGRLLDVREALLGLGDLRGDVGARLGSGLQELADRADRLLALREPALEGVPRRLGGLADLVEGGDGLPGRGELPLRALQGLLDRPLLALAVFERAAGGLELLVKLPVALLALLLQFLLGAVECLQRLGLPAADRLGFRADRLHGQGRAAFQDRGFRLVGALDLGEALAGGLLDLPDPPLGRLRDAVEGPQRVAQPALEDQGDLPDLADVQPAGHQVLLEAEPVQGVQRSQDVQRLLAVQRGGQRLHRLHRPGGPVRDLLPGRERQAGVLLLAEQALEGEQEPLEPSHGPLHALQLGRGVPRQHAGDLGHSGFEQLP